MVKKRQFTGMEKEPQQTRQALTLRVSREMHEDLKAFREFSGKPFNVILTDALNDYFQKFSSPTPSE